MSRRNSRAARDQAPTDHKLPLFLQDPRDVALIRAATSAQYHHGSLHSGKSSKNSSFKQLPGTQASYSAASWAKQSHSSFQRGLPKGNI